MPPRQPGKVLQAGTYTNPIGPIIAVVRLLGRLLKVWDMESFLVWSSRNLS